MEAGRKHAQTDIRLPMAKFWTIHAGSKLDARTANNKSVDMESIGFVHSMLWELLLLPLEHRISRMLQPPYTIYEYPRGARHEISQWSQLRCSDCAMTLPELLNTCISCSSYWCTFIIFPLVKAIFASVS